MENIRRCKVTTLMVCPACHTAGNIWGGRRAQSTAYQCRQCNHCWEVSPEVLVWKRWNIPHGVCFCVFNGSWTAEEMKLVAATAFHYSQRPKEEWGWYKGRHFYTAWRVGMYSGRLWMNNTLAVLADKVAELCKPSRIL
jgi:hypothetical protein